ncbi:hypothetical protein RB195_017750 [Necator americanus]|uniref:Reverse transcriptase domain-containing protein n=1 Tax=Necator americanus TaxID=51031 RepID=A0ABR1C9K3_NECAM
MDLEKFCREDHAFYKVITGDFNANVGPRRTPKELHIGTHGLQWNDQGERLSEFIMTTKTIQDHIIVSNRFFQGDVAVVPKFYTGSDYRLLRGRSSFTRRAEKAAKFRERNPRTTINWDLFATLAGFWEDSAMDNIDKEYDELAEYLHDCAKKTESFKTTKRRLSLKTLELIRQRGAAPAAGNQELTSELARLCREAIKEDLKERRAEVLAEAAEAGQSIRYARRDFASRRTKNDCSPEPKGNSHCIEKGDGENHLRFLLSSLRQPCPLISSPSEGRWTSHSRGSPVRNTTCYHVGKKSYGTRSRQNKTRTPSASTHQHPGEAHARFLNSGRPARPCCCIKREIHMTSATIVQSAYRQPCEQAGFRKGFSTIDHIHTVSKLIEVSREYKMPFCLTFIDLKKAFDSVDSVLTFYKIITIQDTIPSKIFTATLENAMRKLEWDYMGVKVDGRQLHHLRFADDIVLITPSIS